MCAIFMASRFCYCFKADFKGFYSKERTFKMDDVKGLVDRKGMVGALAKASNKIGKYGEVDFLYILDLFNSLKNNTIELSDILPEPLFKPFVKELRAIFYKLADLVEVEDIRREIDKINFILDPNAAKEIKPAKYFRLCQAKWS